MYICCDQLSNIFLHVRTITNVLFNKISVNIVKNKLMTILNKMEVTTKMTYKNRKSLLIHLLIGLIMFQILAIALAAYTGINGIYVILTAFYTVFVVIDIVTADIYDPTSEVTAEFIDDDYLCNGRPDEMCYINGQVDIFNPDKMYCVVSGKRAVGKTTFAKAMSIVNSDIQYITVQDINQLSHNVRQHAFMTYFLAITNNGLPHYIDEVGASNE